MSTTHPLVALRAAARAPLLWATDGAQRMTLRSPRLFRAALGVPSAPLERVGAVAAWRAAERAMHSVPAYADFVSKSGWRDSPRLNSKERLATLPQTDKPSYILAYDTACRCRGGRIPDRDVEVDESSGSSGEPHSWVRSRRELEQLHRTLSLLADHAFGTPLVTINAFSMGAWATGTNVSAALRRNGILKSPGPDVDRVLSALRLLGTEHTYLICGYPPFLRELLDAAEAREIDLRLFRLVGGVGGEGMTESLRDRLLDRFCAVYSSYGASDLDIGVASETPVSVTIRRAAAENPELARALFGSESRLPMLFQYNPLDYHVESVANDAGAYELVVTVTRRCTLNPRIRYNVHDEGGTLGFDAALAVCRDFGFDPLPDAPKLHGGVHPRLPFMYVRGRSDSTLSFMGANIYPEDVERALFSESSDARRLDAFALELLDGGEGRSRPCVHVEVTDGRVDDVLLQRRIAQRVTAGLAAASADYRTSLAEGGDSATIEVRLHRPQTGPFAENSRRIKRRYIFTEAA